MVLELDQDPKANSQSASKMRLGCSNFPPLDQLEERKIERNSNGGLGHAVRKAHKTETGLGLKNGPKPRLLKENCSLSLTHHHHGFLLIQSF